jgi:two-component system sensor histidine kinase PhoQ
VVTASDSRAAPPKRRRSLHARLLVAASLSLATCLGLTGLALDRAFRESALATLQDRLQAQIYLLLEAAAVELGTSLVMPNTLPEPRFSTPGSGLYAEVLTEDGNTVWHSRSRLGRTVTFPATAEPGLPRFEATRSSDGEEFFGLAFTVIWELNHDAEQQYTFRVAESRASFDALVLGFRRSLWVWFAAAAAVLLMVQGLMLRWGLAPVRSLARELADVKSGRRIELDTHYPRELCDLAESLNSLLRQSRRQLERYRNALADLAHSLKTPLAVLRGAVQNCPSQPGELERNVREQVSRMTRTVEYQLARAAASGHTALANPVAVTPVIERLRVSLDKVYAQRGIDCELRVAEGATFVGDESDLMEVLGNLMDNAFKWAVGRVSVRAESVPRGGRSQGLTVTVEDDGPGIPADQVEELLRRGARADSQVDGHGIGLAVVREIVEDAYRGQLRIERGNLGGTQVQVEFL